MHPCIPNHPTSPKCSIANAEAGILQRAFTALGAPLDMQEHTTTPERRWVSGQP